MANRPLLPWLDGPLQDALRAQHGHALLLRGPAGVGQFELALALAQAWLCEAPAVGMGGPAAPGRAACGVCPACRLNAARSHPDLLLLLPEALREALGWPDAAEGDSDKAGKAKPSKEIKVDAVRAAVGFAQSTSARGHGKVVLIYPAEQMNGIAANALLKTLEEPPGAARFILATTAADQLLPTIRSRCQAVPMLLPGLAVASRWLAEQGVDAPEVMLAATGGQAQQVLQWQAQGMGAAQWLALPGQLSRGEPGVLGGWPIPEVLAVLHKLCHDGMCRAAGAVPRYFPAAAFKGLPEPRGSDALDRHAAWARELNRLSLHADHPCSAALMIDALVARAREVLVGPLPPPARGRSVPRVSLHSPT